MEDRNIRHSYFEGGGEMGSLLRSFDWKSNELGTPENWAPSLLTVVELMLNNPIGMCIVWGENFIQLYNDRFSSLMGYTDNPKTLGSNFIKTSSDLWGIMGPKLQATMAGNNFITDNLRLPLEITGNYEDNFECSYNPIKITNGEIGGVLITLVETTEQKRQSEKIKVFENKYKSISEGANVLFEVSDTNNNTTYFNKAWLEFTGRSMDYLMKNGITKLLHPEDRVRFSETFQVTFMNKMSFSGEYRVLDKFGEYKWLMVSASPIFEEQGSFVGYLKSSFDITERRLIEQEYLKFKFIADNASEPFILMCKDGSFDYLNQAALDNWGYTAEEAKKLRVTDVDPFYDYQGFKEMFDRALIEDIPVFETIHKRKDGTTYPVEAKIEGMVHEGVEYLFGTARSIIERKNNEIALLESEQRFRNVADSAPAMIWMCDAEQSFFFFNKGWLNFTGRTQKEESGNGWAQGVHMEDINECYGIFTKAFNQREKFYVEYRHRRFDGEYRWVSDVGVPRFKSDGTFMGYIGTCMDIHEQKMFYVELEKQVKDRTIELEHKNEELKRINKKLKSFAYISSHDLQEPLRKIQLFSSLIYQNENENLSKKGKFQFQRIQSSADRMQSLLKNLLSLSNTANSKNGFEEIDLGNLVSKVKEDLDHHIQEKNVIIKVGHMCRVNVIPVQMRQLIYNIFNNSIKFSSSERRPKIKINCSLIEGLKLQDSRLENDLTYCHIRILDNGIGFDQQYGKKIFELFQTLHSKNEFKGTGIGLTIASEIVENHNGFIEATGHPGKGSRFDIYFPAYQTDS